MFARPIISRTLKSTTLKNPYPWHPQAAGVLFTSTFSNATNLYYNALSRLAERTSNNINTTFLSQLYNSIKLLSCINNNNNYQITSKHYWVNTNMTRKVERLDKDEEYIISTDLESDDSFSNSSDIKQFILDLINGRNKQINLTFVVGDSNNVKAKPQALQNAIYKLFKNIDPSIIRHLNITIIQSFGSKKDWVSPEDKFEDEKTAKIITDKKEAEKHYDAIVNKAAQQKITPKIKIIAPADHLYYLLANLDKNKIDYQLSGYGSFNFNTIVKNLFDRIQNYEDFFESLKDEDERYAFNVKEKLYAPLRQLLDHIDSTEETKSEEEVQKQLEQKDFDRFAAWVVNNYKNDEKLEEQSEFDEFFLKNYSKYCKEEKNIFTEWLDKVANSKTEIIQFESNILKNMRGLNYTHIQNIMDSHLKVLNYNKKIATQGHFLNRKDYCGELKIDGLNISEKTTLEEINSIKDEDILFCPGEFSRNITVEDIINSFRPTKDIDNTIKQKEGFIKGDNSESAWQIRDQISKARQVKTALVKKITLIAEKIIEKQNAFLTSYYEQEGTKAQTLVWTKVAITDRLSRIYKSLQAAGKQNNIYELLNYVHDIANSYKDEMKKNSCIVAIEDFYKNNTIEKQGYSPNTSYLKTPGKNYIINKINDITGNTASARDVSILASNLGDPLQIIAADCIDKSFANENTKQKLFKFDEQKNVIGVRFLAFLKHETELLQDYEKLSSVDPRSHALSSVVWMATTNKR